MIIQSLAALETNTSNVIWTVQVIFRNIYAYANTYIDVVIIRLLKGREFEGDQEGYMEGSGEKKEKEKYYD